MLYFATAWFHTLNKGLLERHGMIHLTYIKILFHNSVPYKKVPYDKVRYEFFTRVPALKNTLYVSQKLN